MKEFPYPTRTEVRQILEAKLMQMCAENTPPDVITFAGNGEPTLHPHFDRIIDDTIELRNKICPKAKVSVLSNSTRIHKPKVFNALLRVDNNILKFDSAIDATIRLLDQPVGKTINARWLIENLKKFEGKLIIQTMFLRGKSGDYFIDNTTDDEVNAWLDALAEIKPQQVMIYTLDREAPVKGLEKMNIVELNQIAEKVKKIGFKVSVAG